MNEERDKRFVILALERGLVTADQVKACRQLQAESASQPPLSILRLLLQRGHLTPDQVVQLASGRHLPDLEACQLVQEFAASALGSACVVEEAGTGKRYVLKVLHPSLTADRDYVRQVHHVAALAARLDHPSVVRTLGSSEERGDVTVVSEFVAGASLRDLLAAKGKLEMAESLSVAIAGATALQKAEDLGITHGAVSPTNLLVAQEGAVKLADLGVAKPRAIEVSLSRDGPGVRSPNYLPPEHFDQQATLDIRSDLFALGAVLYHCLSGGVPFRGDTTAEVIFAIRNGVFRPLKEAVEEVPLAFAAVVEKLLQPEPDRRYASPAALLADLQAIQARRVPKAQQMAIAEAHAAKQEPPKPQAEPEPEVKPRRKWAWALLAAGILLAAAAVGGVIVFTPPKPQAKATEEEIPEEPGHVDPVALARKGRDEIEQVAKAPEPDEAADPAKKLDAVKDKINKLQDLEKKYEGTEAAEEAKKRLGPLQAEALFQAAVLSARAHPGEREANAKRFREVISRFAKTEAAFKAEGELDKLEGVERKKMQQEIEQARQRANALADKKHYGEALSQYDDLLKSNPPEDIKQVILQNKIAIASEADRAYQDFDRRAQEKISGNYYEEAKTLYDQVVASFGVEPYVSRARSEIAIIAPLLKSAATRRIEAIDAAKYQFFLIRLEPSLAVARGWDLSGATREAEKVRPDLRTAGIEQYLDAYLGDVAVLASLKRRVIRRLSDQGAPVIVRQFSLGRVGGKFDPAWLEAKVTRADEAEVVIRYGQLDVRRAWGQFPPDELYRLALLAIDAADARSHLALGIHCLYGNLLKTAARELHTAKAGAPEADSYLERVNLLAGAEKAPPAAAPQEQASRLFMEAKRLMNERIWDRALYRLALLRDRHASKIYDVSANLDEINQRIAQCKKQVEKLEIETNLALGKEVPLLRDSLFDEWQQRFGKWSLEKGVLRGANAEDHDAECLFSLRHPPAYELRAKVRIVEGTGAILRLAGKARPNVGFWLHAAKPALVGLLQASPTDQQADERAPRPYTFQLNQWYELRAVVNPAGVEVAIGDDYTVRMPNKLPPDPAGVQTYGFQVNPKSTAEFRDFSVRTLREQ